MIKALLTHYIFPDIYPSPRFHFLRLSNSLGLKKVTHDLRKSHHLQSAHIPQYYAGASNTLLRSIGP